MSRLFTKFIYEEAQDTKRRIEGEVERAPETTIAETGLENFIDNIADHYSLEKLTIDWKSLKPLGYREVRSRGYDFFGEESELVQTLYKFSVPYVGSRQLFFLHPDIHDLMSQEFSVEDDSLVFELVGTGKKETDTATLDQVKSTVSKNVDRLNTAVDGFNSSIKEAAYQAVTSRVERIRKNQTGFASFGFASQLEEGDV